MRRFCDAKKLICLLSLILCICSFCGCAEKSNEKDNKISVVTVSFAEYDFARAVSGNLADVSMIMKPGGEYHGYEPSFSDIKKIHESDVFIYNGGESDIWIHDVLSSGNYENINAISLIDHAKLLEKDSGGHIHTHSHHGHHDSAYCDYDEHIWLDFDNAISMVETISDALCTADEKNKSAYRENAEKYCQKIREIRDFALSVRENAKRDTIIVGDRFPYLYLTEYLDLSYLSAISGCGHESDAGASDIIEIIDKIHLDDIPVVFYSEMSDSSIAKAISRETGAKVLMLHSCQSIGKEDFESGKTYVDLMYENVENLKEALM